jgi:uncharacterized membrane protein
MLRFLGLWILLSVAVGFWARRIGRSGLSWFLISALVSPIIGTLLLLVTQNFAARRGTYVERIRNGRAYRIVFNLIMAVLVMAFLAWALNRGGMKPIRIAHADWTQVATTLAAQQTALPGSA